MVIIYFYLDNMEYEYNTIGKSVRGASHVHKNIPNEDSIILYDNGTGYGESTYSIISDGHGSDKCFRSDKGSNYATQVLKDVFDELLLHFIDKQDVNLANIKSFVNGGMTKQLVINWRKKVDKDIQLYPFVDQEIDLLTSGVTDENERIEITKKKRFNAYGATLLGVIATPKYTLYVQLGDGDILVVNGENEVNKRLPNDEKLVNSETTSLCLDQAWNDFRVAFDVIDNEPPKMIFLSTDGLSDSYPSEKKFYSFIFESYKLSLENGDEYIEANLVDWLQEITNEASGDDISVAYILSKKKNNGAIVSEKVTDDIENTKEKDNSRGKEGVNFNNKLILIIGVFVLGISIISLLFSLYNFSIIKSYINELRIAPAEVIN